MKTTILTFIAIAGLIVLGGLALLAFHKGDVAQTDFEREVVPASAAAPVPAPPQAAPAIVMTPSTTVEVPAAPAEETPVTGTLVPESAAPAADKDTVPLPEAQ